MDISSLVPAALTNKDSSTIEAGYNKLSENLRRFTPLAIQCAVFCGSRCKYENSKSWPPVHMAIKNIFSHWVTDDVLAMARPNTEQILKNHIIAQFQGWSIKTLINLQTPGEHASCGPRLEKSGFTYNPGDFMKNGIYCYNFAWKDYGAATMEKLLDMVKVVTFSVQEGRVAIHCHAGLGRTGVLIACYLIYTLRVRASDAIRFVRIKRPNAIQTRGQILCIQEFQNYVLPQMIVFPRSNHMSNFRYCSLHSYLNRQYNILHGYEQRTFKHIPKIIFIICERILHLCDCQEDNSPAEIEFKVSASPFTQRFISQFLEKLKQQEVKLKHSWTDSSLDLSYLNTSKSDNNSNTQISQVSSSETLNDVADSVFCISPDAPSCSSVFPDDNCIDDVLTDGIWGQELFDNNCYKEIQTHINLKNAVHTQSFKTISTDEAIKLLLCNNENLSDEKKRKIHHYQVDLNIRSTAWQRLQLETDIEILSSLLYEWLESLRRPILDTEALSQIVIQSSNPRQCLQKLNPWIRYVIEYLMRFVSRLRPLSRSTQNLLVKRLMAAITQQKVTINKTLYPATKNFQKLRSGTTEKLTEFLVRLLSLIEEINTKTMNNMWPTSKWEICRQMHESKLKTSSTTFFPSTMN
ncbi:protein tyrosine phosphatase domain-containing protein 1-like isoform X2 [Leptopilina heterotoma]|uniref:protein tyrosine phosphatase domain-containing protein 1-like isoform X2 n=1 Tax=Leptopilina heterotoma TaxID=63436 RepID=UPI001CA8C727|nr:protein tyrosine phosphatase domain-containing protein 1-like isoform X2 [Leptopilina heterotoma]